MPDGKDASRLGSYTSTIKDLITIVAGVGAIGYAAGFMVVSSHLMRWGITDLNLVKARYISVGFLFIIHVSLVLLPGCLSIGYIARRIRKAPDLDADPAANDEETAVAETLKLRFFRIIKTYYPAILVALLFLIAGVVLSLLLIYLTFWDGWLGGQSEKYWSFLWYRAGALALQWFLPLFAAGFLAPLIALNINRNHRWLGLPNRAWLVPIILILMIIGVRFYATALYGNTASAVGGGSLFLIKLVPVHGKETTIAMLMSKRTTPVPVEGKETTVTPLMSNDTNPSYKPTWTWLIDQSDKSYFILVLPECFGKKVFDFSLDECRPVEISKSVVEGVIHYSSTDGEAMCE